LQCKGRYTFTPGMMSISGSQNTLGTIAKLLLAVVVTFGGGVVMWTWEVLSHCKQQYSHYTGSSKNGMACRQTTLDMRHHVKSVLTSMVTGKRNIIHVQTSISGPDPNA
jgi:hypothetical protein